MLSESGPPPAVCLDHVTKRFAGPERSLHGTKLEVKGPALWARNLARAARLTQTSSPEVEALADISLALAPGEVFGLFGPNGSGKTTLLKILAGLVRPTAGTGEVAGACLAETARIRRRVSYVSTTGWMGLEWALTAEENVRFFAALCGLPADLARERTRQALADMGLWEDRAKRTSELSNGMRQRLILARGLLLHTPLVLLDEPTVGLDPVTRDAVLDLLRFKLPARGQTVVVADHQAGAVGARVDRAAILFEGRIVELGRPDLLTARLQGFKVVEIVSAGEGCPEGPAPDGVRSWDRTVRPGPRSLSHWRIVVQDQPQSLQAVLGWFRAAGRELQGVSERAPGFEDLVSGTFSQTERRGDVRAAERGPRPGRSAPRTT